MGTGLILNGSKIPLPGRDVVNYLDAPQFKLNREDGVPRDPTTALRFIVLHTTTGSMPQVLKPGKGPVGDLAERNARYWTTAKTKTGTLQQAGAHLIVDFDGTWIQTCDLLSMCAYHAGSEANPGVNKVSIGIEVAIGNDGTLYDEQMASLVEMVDLLTRLTGIPRQYLKDRWPVAQVARRFRGIIGHRDVGNRGVGDPGPEPYAALDRAGYPGLSIADHTALWTERQMWLNAEAAKVGAPTIGVDGDPGRETLVLAHQFKRPWGQWLDRPGD